MAWYDEAVFYHIYPLGLTGAPRLNPYGEPEHRLCGLLPWIRHIRGLGCTGIYIGPLFESVGHGYETTDYRKLDSRLGTNEDLKAFVRECHDQGLRVIFDGVFNHTGRDFFAFRDLKERRENSPYKDWYCNVNFWGNNEYNDGFSYENWGGYNLLVKLNQRNPAVRDYICDVVRYWISEFDVDGIRLDAADVLDFDFMKALRATADQAGRDFWLMGEVIHGDYSRWANESTLHSVTNYMMHKALYSGHNDHNYFEIAHTIRHIDSMTGGRQYCRSLYTFVDNHDVERISTKLMNKAHYVPVHILLCTLPGIPSIYYGSEFGIDGPKHRGGSDDAIRPSIHLADFDPDPEGRTDSFETTCHVVPGLDPAKTMALIQALGRIRSQVPHLAYGDYEERVLTTRQYAFARRMGDTEVITAVNNDDQPCALTIHARTGQYTDALSGAKASSRDGNLCVTVPANSGQIWIPDSLAAEGSDMTGKSGMNEAGVMAESLSPQAGVTADILGKTGTCAGRNGEKPAAVCEEKPAGTPGAQAEEKPAGVSEVRIEEKPVGAPEAQAEEKPAGVSETRAEEKAAVTPEVRAEEKAGAPEVLSVEDTAGAPKACPEKRTDAGSQAPAEEETVQVPDLPLEEMTVPQLQQVILQKLAANGPVTDRMKQDVKENIWKNSLLNWAKSFR